MYSYHRVNVFFRWPYFLRWETAAIIFFVMENAMKKGHAAEREQSSTQFQCRYCSKTVIITGETKGERPPGWKYITKESDDGIDSFHLCPDCMNRYRAEQAASGSN